MSAASRSLRSGHALKRRLLAAYTVIEVMMALSVLSVGATGIIAMQKASAIGNMRARDLATANAIAASWIDRLNSDAQRWMANDPASISNTIWLQGVGNDFPNVSSPEGVWVRPASAGGIEPGANVFGNDTTTSAETAFCTNIRLTQVMPKLIRAEVRVYWLRRQGGGVVGGAGTAFCGETVSNVTPELDRYHFIYMTTGIMPSQRNDIEY